MRAYNRTLVVGLKIKKRPNKEIDLGGQIQEHNVMEFGKAHKKGEKGKDIQRHMLKWVSVPS